MLLGSNPAESALQGQRAAPLRQSFFFAAWETSRRHVALVDERGAWNPGVGSGHGQVLSTPPAFVCQRFLPARS